VNTPASNALADFLERREGELLASLLAGVPFRNPGAAAPFLADWLTNEMNRLRGRTTYTAELVARLMDLVKEQAGPSSENCSAARYLRSLIPAVRSQVLEFCLGKVEGVSDRELYQIVLSIEDRYEELLDSLYVEETRKQQGANRRLQRVMAESMGQAFVLLDGDGRITLVNSTFAGLVGVSETNLLHRDFYSLCERDTATEIRRELRQRRSSGPQEFDGALATTRGAPAPLRFSVSPTYDESGLRRGLAVSMFPLKGRPSRESPTFPEIAGETSDVFELGLFTLDGSYGMTYANRRGKELLAALGADDAAAICCQKYKAETGRCGVCLAGGAFDRGQGCLNTVSVQDVEGKARCFDLACAMLPGSGEGNPVILRAVNEVTSRKALENQLLRLQQTSLVSQVAMTVAHQLRNPLGVMIGYAEMLAQGMPGEQSAGAVRTILRHGIRCKDIVENLLEFGQAQPGRRVLTDLSQLIAERVRTTYPSSASRRIAWVLGEGLPAVECVPHQIAQVVVNLVDNALWAAKDKVVVSASAGVRMAGGGRGAPEATTVCIRVLDDGPGVSPDNRLHIFEPFFTTRKEEGGVGLGLSLSRSVVQEHGGRLFLDESVTEGTCFVVELPAVESAKPEDVARPGGSSAWSQGRRVLIVDDEQDLLDLLEAALEDKGYRVDTSPTAGHALDLLKQNEYDLAVLDILLPDGFGGEELFQYLQGANPKLADRALFITADTMNLETRQLLDRVNRPYLEKPFLISIFVEKVTQLLENGG